MTKLHHVKKARKAVPHAGIEPGDSYYWWAFFRMPKQYSKTRPPSSALIRSPFLRSIAEIEEDFDTFNPGDDDLEERRDHNVEAVRELGQEAYEAFENMPESLQQGDTGILLEQRHEQCEEWAEEMENCEYPDRDDYEDEEDWKTAVQDWINEMVGANPGFE